MFAIAQAIRNDPEQIKLPKENDEIFNWPEDLLKPDIVLLLSVSERIRLKRISGRVNKTSQEKLLKDDKTFREK